MRPVLQRARPADGTDPEHADWDPNTELLIEARANPERFAEFYRRTRDPLLAWLYRQTLNAEVAADLAAESFAAALDRLDRFNPTKGSANAWLFGIAAIELQRWWRQGQVAERARRRVGIARLEVDDDSIERIEAMADLRPLVDDLRVALGTLPRGERRALELRVSEGLDYGQIADRLGCSPGAARVRVSRAASRLRAALEPPAVLPWA